MNLWPPRRRIAGCALAVCLVAGLSPAIAQAAGVHCRPEPVATTVNPGDTIVVALTIFQADAPFNAFDASIRFDPSRITFLPPANSATQRGELMTNACPNTFHLFTPGPDSLLVTLSLLCANVSVTGPGVIYRVKFRAGSTPGTTTITLGPSTQFFNAGLFVNPLDTQPMSICISNCTTDVDPVTSRSLTFAAPQPNPAMGGEAGLFRFVLPTADEVALDLFDLQGRRVAGREPQRFPAGANEIAWAAPRLSPGLYVVRLRTQSGGAARRLWTLLR
jgi:hypothetical protein